MSKKSKKIDMLNGSLWDKMIVFALPLAFTGMLQQLFNAADVMTLGRFVSNEAMAGVGNNVPIIGLIISFVMGLALGANVIVARCLGMRDDAKANRAVHTAFATAVIFGVFAVLLGEAIAGPAMDILDVPDVVRSDAEIYLRVFLLGFPFIAIYNFLAAVMRSQGDTQTPLWALVAASLFNIAGNLFAVMAGSVAAFTVEINVYCFINAFGLAATTFVSQNYGAGNLPRCRRATWVSMGLNFVATFMMIALVVGFGRELLSLFTDSAEVIELAMTRIYWVVLFEPISVIMETVSDAMRGYGYSMPPAMVTLICVCSVRIIWVWTVFAAYHDYIVLMIVYPVSWAVTAVALCWLYYRHQKILEKKPRFAKQTAEA